MFERRRKAARACVIASTVLAVAASAVSPAAGQEIVVVARKLRTWRAVLIVEQGDVVRCRIAQSTGDEALDAKGCEAMRQCFETARPQLASVDSGKPARSARNRRLAAINRELQACYQAVSDRFTVYPTGE